MPWTSSDFPNSFKNLTPKQRRQAIHIANDALARCEKKGGKHDKCVSSAIAQALGVVKGGEMVDETKILAEPTRLRRIKENFDSNVRGIRIAFDQVHDPDRGAGGWVEELKVEASSTRPGKMALWAKPEWTDVGRELIENKIFQYISAEFGPYTDAETKKEYQDVLYAASLTNRPFLKDMAAVSAGAPWIEILREGDYLHPEYGKMTIEAQEPEQMNVLRKALEALTAFFAKTNGGEVHAADLSEVNMDAEKEKKLKELLVEHGVEVTEDTDLIDALAEFLTAKDETVTDLEEQLEAAKQTDKETEGAAKETKTQLTESAQKNTQLAEENKQLSERITTIEKELSDQKKEVFFGEMFRSRKYVPAESDDLKTLYDKDSETVRKYLESRKEVIDFKEKGSSSDKKADEETKTKQLTEKAEKIAKEERIGLIEAYVRAAKEDSESDTTKTEV